MRSALYIAAIFLAASTQAFAANICQAEKLSCATTMPIGGYCECKSHGEVRGGTVVPRHAPHTPVNATAGGCNDHPNAPGCPPQ